MWCLYVCVSVCLSRSLTHYLPSTTLRWSIPSSQRTSTRNTRRFPRWRRIRWLSYARNWELMYVFIWYFISEIEIQTYCRIYWVHLFATKAEHTKEQVQKSKYKKYTICKTDIFCSFNKKNPSACIAPCIVYKPSKALRHGSHSFTCNKHHTCHLPRKRSPDGASTDWGGKHLTAAHYSFIDPERMKGWVGLVG